MLESSIGAMKRGILEVWTLAQTVSNTKELDPKTLNTKP